MNFVSRNEGNNRIYLHALEKGQSTFRIMNNRFNEYIIMFEKLAVVARDVSHGEIPRFKGNHAAFIADSHANHAHKDSFSFLKPLLRIIGWSITLWQESFKVTLLKAQQLNLVQIDVLIFFVTPSFFSSMKATRALIS